MKNFNKQKIVIGLIAVAFIIGIASYVRAATFVNLLTSNSFAVLAGSGITNTGATTITGDIGTFPTLSETGFGTITQVGINHVGDAVTQTAKNDLVTAYNAAAAQPLDTAIVADLGGQTLTAGVYNSASSVSLTGPLPLILDGGGNPNAVFIFQAGSTLTTGVNSSVSLINGTQACNVFWQVGSSATIGTGSNFFGNILAMSSITDNGGSTVHGRLLARNFAVTLNNTTVTKSVCSGVAQGTLHIVKHVINDNGGVSPASSFIMHITGTTNISPNNFSGSEAGVDVSLDAGSYSITETGPSGYGESDSIDCSGTINSGGSKICTITNNDLLVPVTPSGGGGGGPLLLNISNSSSGLIPSISVSKSANPTNLPLGIGRVVYTYKVWNSGSSLPLDTVSLSDNLCAPVRFMSGDLNNNYKLDIGEAWNYQCVALISGMTTNIVTATGYGNDSSHKMVTASASATVYANISTQNPVIPGLPKTGFPPQENNMNKIFISMGILFSIGAIGFLLNKKFV